MIVEPARRDEFLALMRETYADGAMGEDEFAWWFDGNPVPPRCVSAAREEDGTALGVLAMSPVRTDACLAACSVHGVTTPAARGRGVFTTLERHNEAEVVAAGVGWTLAFSNPRTLPIFLGPLGWRELASLRLWVRPRRFRRTGAGGYRGEPSCPPFEPRHEDGRIYARGSGDDKGQIVIHLQAARAWMEAAGRLPLNLRIFFEGDEEVGSEPADEFIQAHPELLAADVCVVSDTGMQDDEGTPALTYGIRGIAYFEVKVSGPFQDLHSGGYGGAVANPANVLVKLLASLQDDHGRVTIPGFYDRVRALTDQERAAFREIPFDPEELRTAVDVPALWDGETGYTLVERLSARPTFDINGIWGGYSGEGAKTIIPAWAAAKFSTRLVPDQDFHEIERMVVEHLKSVAPPEVRTEVRVIHGGAPALTSLDHPAVSVAARALEETFGTKPVFLRSGGSIPVVAALEAHAGLKSVLVGFASPNGNFHAPNEWMPEANVHGGIEAIVRLWGALGELPPDQLRG